MNIYQALTNDHDKVKALLRELVALNGNAIEKRSELIAQIRDELVPHSRAEEAVLYNSLRLIDMSKGMAMHSYMEHMEAEGLLRTLQAMDKFDASWKPTAIKLQEALEHHIREEEGELFSAARQLFTQDEATAMAEAFEQMKPAIKQESLLQTTIDMVANLMPPRLVDRFQKSAASLVR